MALAENMGAKRTESSKEYHEGQAAFAAGATSADCPYPSFGDGARAGYNDARYRWLVGFYDARNARFFRR